MLGNYLRKFGLLLSFGYLFLFVKGSLGRNTLASKEVRIVNICGKTKKKRKTYHKLKVSLHDVVTYIYWRKKFAVLFNIYRQ